MYLCAFSNDFFLILRIVAQISRFFQLIFLGAQRFGVSEVGRSASSTILNINGEVNALFSGTCYITTIIIYIRAVITPMRLYCGYNWQFQASFKNIPKFPKKFPLLFKVSAQFSP